MMTTIRFLSMFLATVAAAAAMQHDSNSPAGSAVGHGHARLSPEEEFHRAMEEEDDGTRVDKFLIVRPVFNDAAISLEEIRSNMINTSPSFMSHLEDVSFGKFKLAPVTTGPVTDDGILDITMGFDVLDKNIDLLLQRIDIDLRLLDLRDEPDHIFVMMPYGSLENDFFGDNRDPDWDVFEAPGIVLFDAGRIFMFNAKDVAGDELGHYGFVPLFVVRRILRTAYLLGDSTAANRDDPDESCIMGSPLPLEDGSPAKLVGLNGAKSHQVDWYSNQAVEVDDGIYNLSGMLCGVVDYDPDGDTSSYAVLYSGLTSQSGDRYYVAFNRAIGFNGDNNAGRDKVLVTVQLDSIFPPSALIAELDVGESFTLGDDSLFSLPYDVSVSVASIATTADGKLCADVEIASVALPPTLEPTSAPTEGPFTLLGCDSWLNDNADMYGEDFGSSFAEPFGVYFDITPTQDIWITSFDVPFFDTCEFGGTNPVFLSMVEGYTTVEVEECDDRFESLLSAELDNVIGMNSLPEFDPPIHLKAGTVTTFLIQGYDLDFARLTADSTLATSVRRPYAQSNCEDCPFVLHTGPKIDDFGFYELHAEFAGIINYCTEKCEETTDGSACDGAEAEPTASPSDAEPLVLEIEDYGGDPESHRFPLQRCEGDCDTDDDCDGDLVCHQRGRTEDIPGCTGSLGSRTDFCVRKEDVKNRKLASKRNAADDGVTSGLRRAK